MQIKRGASKAAQLVEDEERRPGHFEGLDACAQALENLPLPQDCHPQPEEDHPVPPQLHHVQTVPEALSGNDREPGAISKNKLLITGNGQCTVSSQGARSAG